MLDSRFMLLHRPEARNVLFKMLTAFNVVRPEASSMSIVALQMRSCCLQLAILKLLCFEHFEAELRY